MKRMMIMAALIVGMTATAMAQNIPMTGQRYADRFPKLPPLKVELNTAVFSFSQSGLQQTVLAGFQHKEADSPHSIMIHDQERKEMPHFSVKRAVRQPKEGGDPLKSWRDDIVRERREKEGRPLPPINPFMIRR